MSTLPQRAAALWTLNTASGVPAVAFTSFLGFELRNESRVVSSQVEEGSFATYNKVETPLEVTVSLGLQGDDAELQGALDTLNALQAGTELISLVTPTAEYRDLNLEGFNYRQRREDGLGALWVELSLVGVKQVAAEYANVKLAPRRNRGKVQARPKEESYLFKTHRTAKNLLDSWFGGH